MSAPSSGMMRSTRVESYRLVRRAGIRVVGALLGLVYGCLLIVGLLVYRWRPAVTARVQQWEFHRLERCFRLRVSAEVRGTPRLRFIAVEALIAVVTGYAALYMVFLLVVMSVGIVLQPLTQGLGATITIHFETWAIAQHVLLSGWIYLISTAIATWVLAEVSGWLVTKWAERNFPTERIDSVQDRIGQLITTRRGVVRAIDDERRRIERDLHDGVQQYAVSLSMLLARARRSPDPEKSRELLNRAHKQSQDLITEVRQVAWQIYPAALDDLGLDQALAMVAQNSPIEVEVNNALNSRYSPEVESATYFVAREAITNAVKHSGAFRISLRIEDTQERRVRLVARDDGRGGANPEGSGLQGLARRVEALDGTFAVNSPEGGPTVLTAEMPDG